MIHAKLNIVKNLDIGAMTMVRGANDSSNDVDLSFVNVATSGAANGAQARQWRDSTIGNKHCYKTFDFPPVGARERTPDSATSRTRVTDLENSHR